jgi:hypothetical protein
MLYALLMNSMWENLLIELGLFILLGILYYFYQRRKIISYEENKKPLVMGFILQACLSEKKDVPQAELDTLIEALDDYLHNKTAHPPMALLKVYMTSPSCSPELHDVIKEGLIEIEDNDGKK